MEDIQILKRRTLTWFYKVSFTSCQLKETSDLYSHVKFLCPVIPTALTSCMKLPFTDTLVFSSKCVSSLSHSWLGIYCIQLQRLEKIVILLKPKASNQANKQTTVFLLCSHIILWLQLLFNQKYSLEQTHLPAENVINSSK